MRRIGSACCSTLARALIPSPPEKDFKGGASKVHCVIIVFRGAPEATCKGGRICSSSLKVPGPPSRAPFRAPALSMLPHWRLLAGMTFSSCEPELGALCFTKPCAFQVSLPSSSKSLVLSWRNFKDRGSSGLNFGGSIKPFFCCLKLGISACLLYAEINHETQAASVFFLNVL